ncbi:uncharacterized protein LOC108339288 [Vigna angularis]|uniref:uncharacterized protein LOC108339288 n=1 Tax=Phaseolus angularis TaxID=3914 RepID=UPI0022B5A019|nr:uncharacterized protein LOC108339288 [Vigna angularis]
MDQLTKSAHFLAINLKMSMEKLAQLYIKEIIRLHGVPSRIISDRDPRFTSRFWKLLQQELGNHLGVWDEVLSLVEFTYNNIFQSSIGMVPFEALYGRKCRTPLFWFQEGEVVLTGPEVIQQTIEKRRRPLEFAAGDHVFLRLNPTTGVGRAVWPKKLPPKFIGPSQILRRIGPVAYEIALPPQLANFHPVFHVSQLRKYIVDPSHVLEVEDIQIKEHCSVEMKPVSIEGSQTKQIRGKTISLVKVVWDKKTEGEESLEEALEAVEVKAEPHDRSIIRMSSILYNRSV